MDAKLADELMSKYDNSIFCFGSNTAGRHGKGAALHALKYGAKHGIGFGHCGRTFAIPTKSYDLQTLPLDIIEIFVMAFTSYAGDREDLTFIVTPIGCGLAGYQPNDIAHMFKHAGRTSNIILPEEFKNDTYC